MQTWIPRTKLNPPDASGVVPRDSLLGDLQAAVRAHKLTLISAPAGSGKTTLVSNLVRSRLPYPVAWLSLDETDNDPSTFVAALIAAFQAVDSRYGETATALFEVGMNLDLKRIMATLINDTLDQPPFLLVLDDLHVLHEQSIVQAFDFLLERLPLSVRVLISTRHDPPLSLARLRAQGQLYELRLESLRFGLTETALLLNGQLNLDLSDADLARVAERTDGWIAGLRLIGLSLGRLDSGQRSGRIAQIIDNNRYIFDLLADEVLKQQDADIQAFLLKTAILDELSPELCDAVTGRADSRRILAIIYRNNLFLRLVDDEKQSYRYHDLFADFLRHQLQMESPDEIAHLHLRAAAAEKLPTRRIDHYLAASAWEHAADLIAQLGRRMIESGNRLTIQNWLDQLPEAVRDHSGWLLYLQGTLAYHRSEIDRALELLDRARARFIEQGDDEGIAEATVMHYASSPENDHIEGLEAFIQTLKPFALTPVHQLYVALATAWVYLYEGYREQSSAHFLEALRLTVAHPELAGTLGFQMSPPIVLAFDDVEPLQAGLQALQAMLRQRVSVLKPSLLGLQAQIALWQGEPRRSLALVDECEQQWDQFGGVPHLHRGVVDWQRAVAAWILGDEREVDRLTRIALEDMTHAVHLAALHARRAWLRGDVDEARLLLDKMPAYFRPELHLNAPAYYAGVQALFELESGGIEAVERVLLPVIDAQRRRRFYSTYILDLRVTLAYCYWRAQLPDEALETLEPLLVACEHANAPGRLAQEGGFAMPVLELAAQRGVHADFARRVLAIFSAADQPRSITIAETGETLTPREVEVLRLMVGGATNRDISETFVISIPTVKTHVSRILQKLNVATRTQAAAKARDLL